MLLKKLIVLIVLMGLIILMSPSVSYAEVTREAQGDFFGSVIGLALAVVIVLLVIFYMQSDHRFTGDAGEMISDVPGLQPLSMTGYLPMDDALSYNVDWLLTDRREGRLWTATGMTFRFPYALDGNFADETELGGNIRMGFRDGQWDYHLNISAFAMDDSEAMAWMTYRF